MSSLTYVTTTILKNIYSKNHDFCALNIRLNESTTQTLGNLKKLVLFRIEKNLADQ